MKTDNKLPFVSNGWLISGKNTKYGNTPVIQVSQISGFTYYEHFEETRKGELRIRFVCSGNNLDWNYSNKDDMIEDYHIIVRLLAGDKTLENKIYI